MNRRQVLRGILQGTAVGLALPWLESLAGRRLAYASEDGFPRRFGVFFWGNGNRPERWTPIGEGFGTDWALSDQLAPLIAHKPKIAVVTGLSVKLPNIEPHYSGSSGLLAGAPFTNGTYGGPTIDQIIAAEIGGETLFRSIQTASTDTLGQSYSGPHLLNPAENNPYALYERLFGPTFVAPGEDAIVDPTLGLRRSILDSVHAELSSLKTRVSTADRLRLEQHADGVRDLETRLARLSEDPPSYEACLQPDAPELNYPDIDGRPQIAARTEVMARLTAMALACDQTRVFGHYVSQPVADVLFPEASKGHHSLTHDEGGDQPECHAITVHCIEQFAAWLSALDAIPEGEGTLLDHCAVLCCSDVSLGQTHSLDEMPIVVAGGAGGRLHTDVHIRAAGQENASKLMLSLLHAMDVNAASFGEDEALAASGLAALEA